jgi:hypothetical protein
MGTASKRPPSNPVYAVLRSPYTRRLRRRYPGKLHPDQGPDSALKRACLEASLKVTYERYLYDARESMT